MSRTILPSALSSHSAHIWGSGGGLRQISAFPIYGWPTAPWAGHAALRIRKPRRRETEREARGPPRTWTTYTRMRCGATRDFAALRTAYRRAVGLGPEGVGSTEARGSARHGDEGERIRRGRELRPLPALAICVLFDRVEDAKGHSAGHSKASYI